MHKYDSTGLSKQVSVDTNYIQANEASNSKNQLIDEDTTTNKEY